MAFMTEAFINNDPSAVNRHVSHSLIQHNPLVGNGKAPLIDMLNSTPAEGDGGYTIGGMGVITFKKS